MPYSDWLRRSAALILQVFSVLLLLNVGLEVWRQYDLRRDAYREYQNRTYSDRQKAADGIASRCAIVGAPTEAIGACLADEIESYQEQDSTEQDLKAQQDMAFWALMTTVVGAGGFILSFGGLIMLWRSLRQTREAINNDREVGHAQVRAYISIDCDQLIVYHGTKIKKCNFKIVNSGQSPAITVNYLAAILIDDFPRMVDSPPYVIHPTARKSNVSIPAGGSIEGEATSDDGIEFSDYTEAISNLSKNLYLYVIVTYKNVFKKECTTEFFVHLNKERAKQKDAIKEKLFYVHDGWHVADTHNWVD